MLKVGVVGCGHLGKIHTKLLSQSENYELIGIYDKDNEESIRVSDEFKCISFESFDSFWNFHSVDPPCWKLFVTNKEFSSVFEA